MIQEAALSPGLEFGDNAFVRHSRRETGVRMMNIESVELADLIIQARAGETEAMEEIYRRFRYSYDRATAEDLLQEIFIKVFTHLDNVKNPDTFAGWVFRIGLNTCYSHLRSRRVEMEKGIPLEDIEGTRCGATEENPARDMRRPLDDGIAALPGKLREIFLLHDVHGFKHEEIARMLGLSIGTSKSQLFKARLRMRAFLARKGVC